MNELHVYDYFEDPAHGWIMVPTSHLHELGIESEVSGCSYMSPDGQWSFLEEDCDGSKFVKAYLRINEVWPLLNYIFEEPESSVRSLPEYSVSMAAHWKFSRSNENSADSEGSKEATVAFRELQGLLRKTLRRTIAPKGMKQEENCEHAH